MNFEEYLRQKYSGPWMATDAVIRYSLHGQDGVVLIQRKYEPLGLAFPGGIAENMEFHENAVKEAQEETGLHLLLDQPVYRPLCVLSNPHQDPRAFIATVVFTGDGVGSIRPHPQEDAKMAMLMPYGELAQLKPEDWAFPHHHQICQIFLKARGDWSHELR